MKFIASNICEDLAWNYNLVKYRLKNVLSLKEESKEG